MAPQILTESVFLSEFSSALVDETSPSETELRRFRQIYGVTPNICTILWRKLHPKFSASTCPKHLLWALRFLKCYGTEEINADAEGCTEKTFRTWCWKIVILLADIDLVGTDNIKFSTSIIDFSILI